MRILFTCIVSGRRLAQDKEGQQRTVYYAELIKTQEPEIRHFGKIVLESYEDLYLKIGRRYNIDITADNDIKIVDRIVPVDRGQSGTNN